MPAMRRNATLGVYALMAVIVVGFTAAFCSIGLIGGLAADERVRNDHAVECTLVRVHTCNKTAQATFAFAPTPARIDGVDVTVSYPGTLCGTGGNFPPSDPDCCAQYASKPHVFWARLRAKDDYATAEIVFGGFAAHEAGKQAQRDKAIAAYVSVGVTIPVMLGLILCLGVAALYAVKE